MKVVAVRLINILVLVIFVSITAACGMNGSAQPVQVATLQQTPVKKPLVQTGGSVVAGAKVVPSQDAVLSFAATGVVNQVLVKEGDSVQAGQVLVQLGGNEKLAAMVSAAELELLNANQAVVDLKAGADLQRAQAQMALSDARRELDKAQKRSLGRDYQRGDPEQVDIARANYVIAEDGVSKAEELYNQVNGRSQDDPVRAEAFSQLAAARQRRDTALANLNYLLAKPGTFDVSEMDAKLALAQAKISDAQRQFELLKDGPNPDQLKLAEARAKNAQVSLDAARSGLADLELKAPFGGTVISLSITPGEFVIPGAPVIRIADLSNMLVETTDLTELNIPRVSLAQPAQIRFDAIPGVETIGRVTRIKEFGENRQGDIVYTVVLQLDKPDPRLRWNMTASVTFLDKDKNQ